MSQKITVEVSGVNFPHVTVPKGTAVVWKNLDPFPHCIETESDKEPYFNPGPIQPDEETSPIIFNEVGEFDYVCRFHHGMTGKIKVIESGDVVIGPPSSGHGRHLKHLHGFVTGGRSADKLYMSHTPILADPRHHFQIILQGSLPDPDQAKAYNDLRASDYEDNRTDIFHEHLSLVDIGNGTINELPNTTITYQPYGSNVTVPGLETGVRVKIDKVLHFHQFRLDEDYPDGLEYLIYGDQQDVFIDHVINRAPGFHSVAKLKEAPAFWSKGDGKPQAFQIKSKRIRDVSPKVMRRAAIVDNAFHLLWLPPSGILRPSPQDPLIKRDGSEPIYDVSLSKGGIDKIHIDKFLHFDVRLLNYGVFILSNEE